jgi:hypothetical protein
LILSLACLAIALKKSKSKMLNLYETPSLM